MAGIKGYKSKKDVRLAPYVHQFVGIAKRLDQMNYEETIFPRRGIYTLHIRKSAYTVYTQNEH